MRIKKLNIAIFSFFLALSIAGNSMATDLEFEEDFETPGINNLVKKWDNVKVYSEEFLEFVTSPVRKGKYALKMTVKAGQGWFNSRGKSYSGVRAEITYDNHDQPGSEKWYAWSFLVPENFKNSPPKLWQVMGQFHDQPNRDKGETWKNWSGTGHSPSVAVYFVSTKASNIPAKKKSLIKNFDQHVRNGVITGISIVAGVLEENKKAIAFIPVTKSSPERMAEICGTIIRIS